MATAVRAADRHTVVSTGWTNPSNAYSTTGDNVYATAVPAKNGTITGDFGFAAFTDAEIPVGATITAVRLVVEANLSAVVTGGVFGIKGRNNAVDDGAAEVTKTTAAEEQKTFTFSSVPSITDLKTAGRITCRARAAKGNTSSALTENVDFVKIEVDYTVPSSWEQKSFRFRNDDGSETTATWKAAANTNVTLAIDTRFRLRFVIQLDSGAATVPIAPRLQYRIDAGGWTDVGFDTELVDVRYFDSANVADGDPTTQQLGAGTFDSGKVTETPLGLPSTITLTHESEFEYSVDLFNRADSGSLANGQVLDFRLKDDAGIPFATYTVTPSVTLGSAGVVLAAVLAGVSGGGKALGVTKPLAVVLAGVSGGAKALGVQKPLAGVISGTGGVAAALGNAKQMASVLPGVGAVVAVIGVTKRVAAVVAGSGGVASALGVTKQLAAALLGQGAAAPNLTVTSGGTAQPLSAILAGSGVIAAPLGLAKFVVAQLNGVSAIAAPLGVAKQVVASIGGSGSATGDARVAKALASSSGGSGGLVAAVQNQKRVVAVLSGAGAAVSTVTNSKPVTAILSSSGATTAQLAVERRLAAVVDGGVTVMAALSVGLGDIAPKLRRMMGLGE